MNLFIYLFFSFGFSNIVMGYTYCFPFRAILDSYFYVRLLSVILKAALVFCSSPVHGLKYKKFFLFFIYSNEGRHEKECKQEFSRIEDSRCDFITEFSLYLLFSIHNRD
jgi:hypothetical protein